MNLYLVHCGFYDDEISNNVYEFHINLFTAASNQDEAKENILNQEVFKKKKMHIDGIQKISEVSNFQITLIQKDIQ